MIPIHEGIIRFSFIGSSSNSKSMRIGTCWFIQYIFLHLSYVHSFHVKYINYYYLILSYFSDSSCIEKWMNQLIHRKVS